jgi:hypothetical protein
MHCRTELSDQVFILVLDYLVREDSAKTGKSLGVFLDYATS